MGGPLQRARAAADAAPVAGDHHTAPELALIGYEAMRETVAASDRPDRAGLLELVDMAHTLGVKYGAARLSERLAVELDRATTGTMLGNDGPPGLVLTVGPPGSGKSHFVGQHFRPEVIFSLDQYRRDVAGDAGDQSATTAAVAMLDTLVGERVSRPLLTVVDGTHGQRVHRSQLLSHVVMHDHRTPTCLVVMHTPLDVCKARRGHDATAGRPGAYGGPVDPDVITLIHEQISADLDTLTREADLVVHVPPPGTDYPLHVHGSGGFARGVMWPWLAGAKFGWQSLPPLPWKPVYRTGDGT